MITLNNLSRRQAATIRAALTAWQDELELTCNTIVSDELRDIATDGGTVPPLDSKEVNALIGRIGRPAS